MNSFTYEELKMIKTAMFTEICRREDNPNTNTEKLQQFEALYEKVYKIIKDIKGEQSCD